MTQKEQVVYEAVRKNPGTRARYLPTQMWVAEVATILNNLEARGIVYHKFVQGEDCTQSHYIWYVTE